MHILLAEDDMKLGKLIKYMLEQNGISTEWVTTGDMIYDYAMYEDYDVLVLDWMMPKMSGVDACKKLRSDGYQRAILLLTARDSIEDRVTGLDAGADDYITKPFSTAELQPENPAGYDGLGGFYLGQDIKGIGKGGAGDTAFPS